MRAEWVIYLDVRSIGIKIAFYRVSSPVLFMPWEQWHTVRIIISVETHLFTCRGTSLFILLMNSSHSYAIHGLSAVSQRGWFLEREYWFELKYSHILHSYWTCTSPGASSVSSGTLYSNIYMSIYYSMTHDYVKTFLPVFLFKGKQNPRKYLYCWSHIDHSGTAQWTAIHPYFT